MRFSPRARQPSSSISRGVSRSSPVERAVSAARSCGRSPRPAPTSSSSSRKQDACEEAAAEVRSFGRRAFAHCCHIGHWDEIDGLVDAAYDNFGQVDILVNNAGLAPTYPNPQGVTEELWDKTIARQPEGAVPPDGPRRRADGRRRRRLDHQHLARSAASARRNDILPYAAAKAGLNALTIGFADALGPKVRVNAVMPGPFLTDISRNWDHEAFADRARTFPLRRAGDPDELASAVLYFASDASSFTTGAVLAVDGGAQWSLAGGGEQAEYGHSLYDGKRDWT